MTPLVCNLGTSLAFYRGQKGPSLENSERSLKRGSRGLSAPGSKKREKVEKESKTSQKPEKNLKNSHFRLFFRAFSAPRPRVPGNPFSDFCRSFLGRGLFDPCRRPTMSLGVQPTSSLFRPEEMERMLTNNIPEEEEEAKAALMQKSHGVRVSASTHAKASLDSRVAQQAN